MELYFKDDWIEAPQILTGWWNHRVEGRWALGIRAPRNRPLKSETPPPLPDDFKKRWLDYKTINRHKELAELIKSPEGHVPFMAFNTWAPGRAAKVQCDFSAMISPDMYAEFVLPHLQRQCRRLDYTVYHLDGPDAIRHLDAVLTIPEINAVQWEPGAGNPHTGDKVWWDPIWRKVYAAGKSAFLHGVPPDEIKPFVEEFGQDGTLVITAVATEDQALKLMDDSLNW